MNLEELAVAQVGEAIGKGRAGDIRTRGARPGRTVPSFRRFRDGKVERHISAHLITLGFALLSGHLKAHGRSQCDTALRNENHAGVIYPAPEGALAGSVEGSLRFEAITILSDSTATTS